MQLFLTASANEVLSDIVNHLSKKPSDYNLAFISTAADVETGYLARSGSLYTESVPIIPLNNKQYLWVDNDQYKICYTKP